MERLFHILGIVYYTLALLHLLAEIRKNRRKKDKRGQE